MSFHRYFICKSFILWRNKHFFSGGDLPNILCKLFSAGLFEGIATISGNIRFFFCIQVVYIFPHHKYF